MIESLLNEVVRRIVDIADPKKIVLFGSHARGNSHAHSDIDLLVIMESQEPRYRRSAPLYGALSNLLTPMDILVYRPNEVEEWKNVPQAFVTTVLREGKTLYEK